MKLLIQRCVLACIGISILRLAPGTTAFAVPSEEEPPSFSYKSGYSVIVRLGRDLYKGLQPSFKEKIHFSPILIETNQVPYVRLVRRLEHGKEVGLVAISAGFVDLVNQIAHAKAIDRIERGYFKRYMRKLAEQAAVAGESELQPLPGDTDRRFWTERVLNEQLSNFNSIVGVILGIKLSHFYLGHYDKYKPVAAEGASGRASINDHLASEEWEQALRDGVVSSLRVGCAIEGVLPFFECLDRIPDPPPWVRSFLPGTTDYKTIRRIATRLQADFFAGRLDD